MLVKDLILTGRGVTAREAQDMGLANRVVAHGKVNTRHSFFILSRRPSHFVMI